MYSLFALLDWQGPRLRNCCCSACSGRQLFHGRLVRPALRSCCLAVSLQPGIQHAICIGAAVVHRLVLQLHLVNSISNQSQHSTDLQKTTCKGSQVWLGMTKGSDKDLTRNWVSLRWQWTASTGLLFKAPTLSLGSSRSPRDFLAIIGVELVVELFTAFQHGQDASAAFINGDPALEVCIHTQQPACSIVSR